MSNLVQRKQLGAFLRARREATEPAAAGFPSGRRRRTPGLRREEVAKLAGMSTTWYTWIEQGRDITVSSQVLESLARALQLSGTERTHLFTLANLVPPSARRTSCTIDPLLGRLVQELSPKPAYVVNPWWDLLAYNDAYAELLGGLEQRPEAERNIMWILFAQSHGSELFTDWPCEARSLVGQWRMAVGQHPNNPRGQELLRLLRKSSGEFRRLWDEQIVEGFRSPRKTLLHPRLGRLDLDYLKLTDAHDDQNSLIVFMPVGAPTPQPRPPRGVGCA